MSSRILRTATRYMYPLLLLLSVFLLLRGHNNPGGGFVGGLTAAAALSLYALAYDVPTARALLRVDPRILIAWGLLSALGSGLISMALGEPFLTGKWTKHVIGGIPFDLGTPLLFDLGVYLVVLGVSVLIIFSLAEEP